jgi:hypothetical protein
MKDRITRELQNLQYRMLAKLGNDGRFSPTYRKIIMDMLKETIDEMEKERTTLYGQKMNPEMMAL